MDCSYGNEKGIGIFYPEESSVLSGMSKIYGLAYVNEGWLEDDKGVAAVEILFGGKYRMKARTYCKNRFWIRTLDAGELSAGPLEIQVTAYNKEYELIGTVATTVQIASDGGSTRRLFASADGTAQNDGSIGSPWDLKTALKQVEAGDILYLRGGIYNAGFIVEKSGRKGRPIIIANYHGEQVELKGTGIAVLPDVGFVQIMGIDQSGCSFGDSGVELGDGVHHVEFWDCSFNANTHPYEDIDPNEWLNYGVGFQALTTRGRDDNGITTQAVECQNRQFITVSHCEAKYNSVDGFDFSSIDHGRFQFLEAAWNPNHKSVDLLQYKHADGFTIKNSEWEPWGFPSRDCVFLYCCSHHNGQDGFDIRSPHVRFFGCVSHDESQSGYPYGGSGIKTWEYDYKFYNCLTFRNNITDRSGYGLEAGNNSFLCNCLFYNTYEYAVARPDESPLVKRIFSHNNVFVDCNKGFSIPVRSYNSVCFGSGEPKTLLGVRVADPRFSDAEKGNFFPQQGSPLLQGGCMQGLDFIVDGVDYAQFDGLGRPRAGTDEIGPYTRYSEAYVE